MLRKSRERFSGVFVSKTISQDHSSLNWHSEPISTDPLRN